MAYIWIYNWDNGVSDWKDSERCVACSKKKFIHRIDAYNAGMKHAQKHAGLGNYIEVRKIHGNSKWR